MLRTTCYMDMKKEVRFVLLFSVTKYLKRQLIDTNIIFTVPFAVEERSGVITVIDELSKFDRPLFDFEAVAMQEKLNITISTNATVHVVDVNDERGVFLK